MKYAETTGWLKQSFNNGMKLLGEAVSLEVKDWWKGRVFERTLPLRYPVERDNSRGWIESSYFEDESLIPLYQVTEDSSSKLYTDALNTPPEDIVLH